MNLKQHRETFSAFALELFFQAESFEVQIWYAYVRK